MRLIERCTVGTLLCRQFVIGCLLFSTGVTANTNTGTPIDWQQAVAAGDFDAAANLARGTDTNLGRLIDQAEALSLSESKLWQALLHYQNHLRGVKSQVDSPWFFQSADGKTDSSAELAATLAAMFRNTALSPLRLSPYCRFIARRDWLAEQLGELFYAVPVQDCPEAAQFMTHLNAQTLTLVFPASHPNSPASAFGHTLLRVDQEGQSDEARLLNMSINFAAEVPEGVDTFTYLFGGLAGGFPGKFRLLPYHMKLREYRHIDNRDTWEYPLKLDQKQIDLIVRHTYEMLIAEFDYYFFKENCSYHLLGLLDVAFADDPMAHNFSLWTIPVDTIKLLQTRGLIDKDEFVPSTIQTLRKRESLLTENERRIALNATHIGLDSVADELDQLSDDRAAQVLDTISDYNRYTRLKDNVSASGLSDVERTVLSRRSKIQVKSEALSVARPNLAPQLGHDTARLSLTGRRFDTDESEFKLSYRAAYHDLRDPSIAYGNRAAINFLTVSASRDTVDGKVYLSEVSLIDIESIEPRSQFFKPFSWRTRFRWTRPGASQDHRFTATGGVGVSYRWGGTKAPAAFAFIEGDAVDDPSLPKRLSAQIGSRIGMHWEPVLGARFGTEWEHRELIGERRYDSAVSAWASLSPARNGALVLEATESRVSDANSLRSLSAEWRWYF